MIRYFKEEKREGDLAVMNCRVTLFGITIYKGRVESTNINAIRQLTQMPKKKPRVCGFTL